MSGGKTTGQALGGIAVILLTGALQISGYQSPLVAFILAVLAFFLLLPWLNEQRKVVAKAGKQIYGEYGKPMVITVVVAALLGALLFGALAVWGWQKFNAPSINLPPKILTTEHGKAITAESPGNPSPQPPRHINTLTVLEIHKELEQAGPLERDDVAEQFRHGIVDWTLIFDGDLIRHKGTDLMTVRFLPVNSPYPNITCPGIKLEGNAYLGRVRSPTRFRVRGVIGDIDLKLVTLHEATFEQLSDTTPTPTPLREEGPKVEPPQQTPLTEPEAGPKVVPPKEQPERPSPFSLELSKNTLDKLRIKKETEERQSKLRDIELSENTLRDCRPGLDYAIKNLLLAVDSAAKRYGDKIASDYKGPPSSIDPGSPLNGYATIRMEANKEWLFTVSYSRADTRRISMIINFGASGSATIEYVAGLGGFDLVARTDSKEVFHGYARLGDYKSNIDELVKVILGLQQEFHPIKKV